MEQVNGLQVYMKQIREIPLLTADQEKELAIKYQTGDKRAKDKLVTSTNGVSPPIFSKVFALLDKVPKYAPFILITAGKLLKKYGALHEFECHPSAGAMLILPVHPLLVYVLPKRARPQGFKGGHTQVPGSGEARVHILPVTCSLCSPGQMSSSL